MNLQIIETKETKEAKTSVDTVDFALIEYTAEDHSKDIDAYLDTAVQADKFGCGSRYGIVEQYIIEKTGSSSLLNIVPPNVE